MLPASSKGDSIEDELNCVDACLFFRVPDRGSVNFFGGGTNRASRAVKDETGGNRGLRPTAEKGLGDLWNRGYRPNG